MSITDAELLNAFHQAICEVNGWHGTAEPSVNIGRQTFLMSDVCELVDKEHFSSQQMPDPIIDLILAEADGTYPPLFGRSYQDGARYLLKIIRQRQDGFKNRRHYL